MVAQSTVLRTLYSNTLYSNTLYSNTLYLTAPLSNKTILITRAAHQAEEIGNAVRRLGGSTVFFPTIEMLPPNSWDECDRAIDTLYMYDGVIFTSTNGVEFFLQRLKDREVDIETLMPKMIFVVGEKTKQSVERHRLPVRLMPDRFTSFDLSRALEQQDLTGKSFLFPRGNLGTDILQDNLKLLGANVDSVIVYQTVRPKDENIVRVRDSLMSGSIDVVTFTSPSTFQNFSVLFTNEQLQTIFARAAIAVIGPVTARAVSDAGFEPDVVSGESTVESLIDAVAAHISSRIANPKSGIKK